MFSKETIDYLTSLENSELIRVLSLMPRVKATAALQAMKINQTQTPTTKLDDAGRMRIKRNESARIVIPEPKDINRRESCLKDPEKYLRTYFKPIFYNPFAKHHLAMIDAIWQRCWSGGDKSVAAPRGDGKTQVTVSMTVVAVTATPVRFPVLIGNTLSKGRKLFKQFKNKFEASAKYRDFHDDFPELCVPVVSLQGAPQRANNQHVAGELTRITWSQELVVMPTINVPWSTIPAGGKRLVYFGLDSAIRGEGFEEDRPDIAIIDDPETREVAFSPTNRHYEIEEMIDGDVAGLSGPNKRISRIVLTTIQRHGCYSDRVTNPKVKPAFSGERHALLIKWPEHREMWDEYIALRQSDQANGLKDGPNATEFYLQNQDKMKEGSELSNPYRFVSAVNEDGHEVEVDALQAFFNRVADWGEARVLAELQQAPEPEEQDQTANITPGRIQQQISGFGQNELPRSDVKICLGLDIGKYFSHWTKIAFTDGAAGFVIDYGVLETPNMEKEKDAKAIEVALLSALHQWRSDMLAENPPDFALIDSGSYSDAVYEFVRQVGFPFAASKGRDTGQYGSQVDSQTKRVFHEATASYQAQERIWLYLVNSDYWKRWVHERFATPVTNEANQFNDGALSLFQSDDRKRHLAFAHHICAQEWQESFVQNRGVVKKWVPRSKNDHWLDSTALACAAGGVLGIRLLRHDSVIQQPTEKPPWQENTEIPQENREKKNVSTRTAPNFRRRPGGWLKGMGR